jgi:hypothetical protein
VLLKRLRRDCHLTEGKDFVVRDLPRSEDQFRKLSPFEFENWAVSALGVIKNKTQVGGMGIVAVSTRFTLRPKEERE